MLRLEQRIRNGLHPVARDLRLVTPHGAKPYVAGTGLPAGLDVNISHAAGLVGCVVGLGAAVGIDIEHVGRVADAGAIT